MKTAKHILILKHVAFGDIMQCEGALNDIRENNPDDQIQVLNEPDYAKLMKH